jgi:phosphatidylethanolamine-binding protein (PEBP) family uncharacterized protein
MRRPKKSTISGGVISLALVLAGCGSSSSPPSAISVPFRSPAVVGTSLPAVYTCDGKDISPPLEWGAVPPASADVAVFALGLTPAASNGSYAVSVEWAVAGINAALHRITAGRLPRGAYLGVDSNGKARYSICPKKGESKRYEFAIYGIPRSIGIPVKFQAAELLKILASPSSTYGSRIGGSFLANYTRKTGAGSRHA